MKTFLVKATVLDGEHESYNYGLIKAETQQEANAKAEASAPKDDCGLDTTESIWGWGDGMSSTRIRDVIQIGQIEEEVIRKFNFASALEEINETNNYAGRQ